MVMMCRLDFCQGFTRFSCKTISDTNINMNKNRLNTLLIYFLIL